MSSQMLIDATHREETRVVVKRGQRVEEFDFETAAKKQIRGNIYLAKVTRVEPSLQAAFVDYGGNRHGFLAFSEIHPDYYQIPQADRDALLEEERSVEEDDQPSGSDSEHSGDPNEEAGSGIDVKSAVAAGLFADEATSNEDDDSDAFEESGSDDALEEARPRRRANRRNYKIQEVIKRRQIILVQVVKEERGNKGAALTTYLSLAGRYAVLMPNTPRGGGISRKITSATDRKRLKAVVSDLDVPEGMGVILRTAGANRTKVEIKRDFEYMMRLWETVRDLTLKSAAPALVYEEGSLIKRSIRDLYSRDIDSVLVAGDEGYREAKDFMRMLMPSHARNVQPYREPTPLFTAHGVEDQLDTMFEPTVRLKSGGYLVINQTEALVAIDVNSGKSTKEHSIEDTALQTNLEAADEIARQLRLRDLAGLVVCDFIDMEEKRNNRSVEKRMKDALKSDRARIQVGRISHFGLLEMSRQRIRTSILESTMEPCPHCGGTGYIRAAASVALQVLRQAEAQLLRHKNHHAKVTLRAETVLYILNNKRAMLADLEGRYGRKLRFSMDESLAADAFTIGKGDPADPSEVVPVSNAVQPMSVDLEEDERADEEAAARAAQEESVEDERAEETRADDGDTGDGRKRRRRRRRRRSETGDDANERSANADGDSDDQASEDAEAPETKSAGEDAGDEDGEPKRRRRSRRGGRRRRGGRGSGETETATENGDADADAVMADGAETAAEPTDIDEEASEASQVGVEVEVEVEATAAETADKSPVEPVHEAATVVNGSAQTAETETTEASETIDVEADDAQAAEAADTQPPKDPVVESSNPEAEKAPKKQGWWQRRSFF